LAHHSFHMSSGHNFRLIVLKLGVIFSLFRWWDLGVTRTELSIPQSEFFSKVLIFDPDGDIGKKIISISIFYRKIKRPNFTLFDRI